MLLGYKEDEIIGQNISIFFTPEDRARGEPEKELHRARTTGRGEDDRWHVRKEGSRFWASGVLTPLHGDGGLQGFGKILRDRTEQKLSEERIRLVLYYILDGVITIDEHGTIDTFNPAAEKIFGYSAAEVIGQNVNILMPEPFAPEHDRYLADYLRTGQPKILVGSARWWAGARTRPPFRWTWP